MKRERARINIRSGEDAMALVACLRAQEDSFSIESRNGARRVNAKSLLAVICSMFDLLDEMYLVNDTHNGVIPTGVHPFVCA